MNAQELSAILADQIHKLRSGRCKIEVARNVNATAGRLLSTQKLLLDYARVTRQIPDTPFLQNKPNGKKRLTK